MQPPGNVEEQSFVSCYRLFPRQEMVESRAPSAVRMATLHRLVELLRITQQDQRFGCLGDREHICEGHLRRLVDEQNVKTFERVLGRPQPRRPACDVAIAMQGGEDLTVTLFGKAKAVGGLYL